MRKRIMVLVLAICVALTALTGCFGDKGCFGDFAADSGSEYQRGESGGSGGSGSGSGDSGSESGSGSGSQGGDIPDTPVKPVTGDRMYVTPNEFRFAAYSTPPNAKVGDSEGTIKYNNNPNYNIPEHWVTLKNGGFDWGIPIYYDQNDTHIKASLASAEAAGVKILVTNYDSSPDSLQQIVKMGKSYSQTRKHILDNEASIKAHIDMFAAYKSFGGLFVGDEPSTDLYPAIAAAQDWFEKEYPDYEFYTNLLPNYASQTQLFGSDANKGYTYEDYVKRFVDVVNPFLLSYDHYPFVYDYYGNKTMYSDTLYNMVVFAEQARRIDVPWFVYLQSMQFEGNSSIDYLEEWAWQCYAALACGTKGIQTFCYWTLLSDTNNIDGGIVNRDGSLSPRYTWVKDTLEDIKFIEDEFCSFDWEGVMSFVPSYEVPGIFNMLKDKGKELSELKKISKVETSCNSLIGQFGKAGKKAYMVTNLDEPFWGALDGQITLTFTSDITKVTYYYMGEKHETQLGSNKTLTLNVALGQGCFVIPE